MARASARAEAIQRAEARAAANRMAGGGMRGGAVELDWHPETAKANVKAYVVRNMRQATLYAKAKVQEALSRSQPTRVVQPRDGGPPYRVGKKPSEPGEAPKMVTGDYRRSVLTEVKETPEAIIGLVGSNLIKAARLEFGFVGTDARGRVINQEARPAFRSTLSNNRDTIVDILARGGG